MRPKSMRSPNIPERAHFFSAHRRVPRRSFHPALRFALEALEPRTLLSNLWYVNSADTGTPDGLTPSTGFLSIQAAINTAAAGDTILVETGNGYNESDTVGLSNLTIEADSGQSPVLDGTTPSAQSSPGFTVAAGTTGVTIEGFTIQNFSGTSAIAVQNGAALTLSDDTIQDNMNSGGYGGGIYNDGTLTDDGGTILNNLASDGGGIYNDGTITLADTMIEQNTATSAGMLRRRRHPQRRHTDGQRQHDRRQYGRQLRRRHRQRVRRHDDAHQYHGFRQLRRLWRRHRERVWRHAHAYQCYRHGQLSPRRLRRRHLHQRAAARRRY